MVCDSVQDLGAVPPGVTRQTLYFKGTLEPWLKILGSAAKPSIASSRNSKDCQSEAFRSRKDDF